MQYQAIRDADYRLAEALSRLNRARRIVSIRRLEGCFDERDIDLLTKADAEVEKAAAALKVAQGLEAA